jgi:hypothetical protein
MLFRSVQSIKPETSIELEQVPLLVRARVKIQNEYELFQADGKARRRRPGLEMREAVHEDAAPRQTLQVFPDETGKTGAHLIVGAVWLVAHR